MNKKRSLKNIKSIKDLKKLQFWRKKRPAEDEQKSSASRNIWILGIASVSIALLTTIVSLVIYHNSGDIYLDRSRPGYLPDESEVENEPESIYSFPSSGPISESVLDEYAEHYQEVLDYIDDLNSPFSETPLSDDSLGIPPAPEEPPADQPAE